MREFTADYVYTQDSEPIKNGTVITDDGGKILSVSAKKETLNTTSQYYQGAIVPGFVNAHCHLELSHLHQKIPQGKGLVSFIKNVISLRSIDEETQLNAAQTADETMYKNGIVAVGDICNTNLTAQIKAQSCIKYHAKGNCTPCTVGHCRFAYRKQKNDRT